jgi:hypothetical protein
MRPTSWRSVEERIAETAVTPRPPRQEGDDVERCGRTEMTPVEQEQEGREKDTADHHPRRLHRDL